MCKVMLCKKRNLCTNLNMYVQLNSITFLCASARHDCRKVFSIRLLSTQFSHVQTETANRAVRLKTGQIASFVYNRWCNYAHATVKE